MASNSNLTAAYSAHHQGFNTDESPYPYQQLSQPAVVSTEPIDSFDEFVQYPEDMFGSSKLYQAPNMLPSATPMQFSFRPMEPNQQVLHHRMPVIPPSSNINAGLPLPTPGVLSGHFDPAEYRPFPYEDLAWASFDQGRLSTISIKTDVSSPITPGVQEGGHAMDWYSNHESRTAHEHLGSFNHTSRNAEYGHPHGVDYTTSNATSGPENLCGLPIAFINHPFPDFPGAMPVVDTRTTSFRSAVQNDGAVQAVSASPQDIERRASTPSDVSEDEGSISPSDSSQLLIEEETVTRSQRDELLLDMRRQGRSYKHIKRLGRFWEAESTLRGRVRALTKAKSERVRKPKWEGNDLSLLRRAVRHFADGADETSHTATRSKVPWKKVSTWMRDQGGSYLFAPGTCAKKWAEIRR